MGPCATLWVLFLGFVIVRPVSFCAQSSSTPFAFDLVGAVVVVQNVARERFGAFLCEFSAKLLALKSAESSAKLLGV